MNLSPAPRQSDSERLAGKIMADIQARTLAPGMWLKQIDIEQRYSCTRNVARAALNRLASQRYIEHEPNRGFRVPAFEGPRRIHFLRMRAILESTLAPEMVANVTPEAIRELREHADNFSRQMETSGFLNLMELNRRFHFRMFELVENSEQLQLVRDARSAFRGYPGTTWDSPAMMRQSAIEHHLMVDALEARDSRQLMKLIVDHIGKGELGRLSIVFFEDN